jgi:hypothetical protein
MATGYAHDAWVWYLADTGNDLLDNFQTGFGLTKCAIQWSQENISPVAELPGREAD